MGNSKNIIAIETSCSKLSVAARKGSEPVCEATVEGFYQHAENLLPLIDQMLAQAGFTLKETTDLLINRGPGSFTGLRVGFATLKGLRLNTSIQCRGAVSLDLIAQNIPAAKAGQTLAVCLDARRDKIFMRQYNPAENKWTASSALELLSADEVRDKLPARTYICGDALKRYSKEFAESAKGFDLAEEKLWYPKASSLILLDQENNTDFITDLTKPEDFIPYYFRLSDPEEKRENNAVSC